MRARRLERKLRPLHVDPAVLAGTERGELFAQKPAEICALPARLRQHSVDAGESVDAAFDRARIISRVCVTCQPHDRLHEGKRILGAVIDLAREQRLAFLGCLAIGDVDCDAANSHQRAGRIMRRGRARQAPADIAIRPPYAIFHLQRRAGRQQSVPGLVEHREIVRIDEGADILGRDDEIRANAENSPLALIPEIQVINAVPVPAAHLAGGERKRTALFALQKLRG